jgi:hypothetical protein
MCMLDSVFSWCDGEWLAQGVMILGAFIHLTCTAGTFYRVDSE